MESLLRPRNVFAWLAALVLGTGGDPCLARQAIVRLIAHAEPAGSTYSLGDISAIDSADATLARTLAATRIGITPRMNYSEAVPRRQIAELVERSHPQLRETLRWQGADTVSVRGRGQEIEARTLIDLAARTLVDALAKSYTGIDVQPVGELANVRVPGGSLNMAARLPEKPTPSRRMCVWVDVQVNGKDYRSLPVWFSVKATREVLVARVPLRAGEMLRAGDFVTAPVDVTELGSAPVLAADQVERQRLRRPLEAGQTLLAAQLEPRPAVVRNQTVEVKLVLGSIQIETAGIALADARLGEAVRIKNPANNQSFGATVIADGKVLIQAR